VRRRLTWDLIDLDATVIRVTLGAATTGHQIYTLPGTAQALPRPLKNITRDSRTMNVKPPVRRNLMLGDEDTGADQA
jgi:hypothetical protein